MAILLIISISLLSGETKCAPYENGLDQYSAIKASTLLSNIKKSPSSSSVTRSMIESLEEFALPKLYEISQVVNELYIAQLWKHNEKLAQHLSSSSIKSKCKGAVWEYFELNMCPWDALNNNSYYLSEIVPSLRSFSGDSLVAKDSSRPLGANFYPLDMQRSEFEQWVNSLKVKASNEEVYKAATGFYHVIRRNETTGELMAVPYSEAFEEHIVKLKQLTEELIPLLPEEEFASLIQFLKLRAEAFHSNDYDASDVAWLNVSDDNSLLEVTLGPYETYDDELFGYKAAFEMFVGIRNATESAKLQRIVKLLPSLSTALPIDSAYTELLSSDNSTAKVIRVVDQIMNGGEARRGVQTAAYNLPNNAHVVDKHGSKRVLLRNIQEAKYEKTLVPLKSQVLSSLQSPYVDFESFFMHVMAHELMHGMGPRFIYSENKTNHIPVRVALQEHYSVIEEAKADVGGLWLLCNILNNNLLELNMTMSKEAKALQTKLGLTNNEMFKRSILVTYMTSIFRSIKFEDSHARAAIVIFNYLNTRNAITVETHTNEEEEEVHNVFANFSIMETGIHSLLKELLNMQADGDKHDVAIFLEEYGVIEAELETMIAQIHHSELNTIHKTPVDIRIVYDNTFAGKK